jgi:Uma2 family endonuclease
MTAHERTTTRAEYEALLLQHPDRRFERVDGEIVEKIPTLLHAYIIQMLSGFFFVFLRENSIDYALVEARYHLPADEQNDRIPDYSFISAEREPSSQSGPATTCPIWRLRCSHRARPTVS